MKAPYNATRRVQYNPFYGKSPIHRENRGRSRTSHRLRRGSMVRALAPGRSDGSFVPYDRFRNGRRGLVLSRGDSRMSGSRVRQPHGRESHQRIRNGRMSIGRFVDRRFRARRRNGNHGRGFFRRNRLRRRERRSLGREFLDLDYEI